MDSYHFINLPRDANAYDQQRDCKLRNCVIEAIAWYLQVLKSPEAPRNEKLHSGLLLTSLATYISRFMPGSQRIAAATELTCASTAAKKTCIHCGTPHLLSWRKALRLRSPGEYKLQ